MGFCPNCGKPVNDQDLFCDQCGESLAEYQEAPSQTVGREPSFVDEVPSQIVESEPSFEDEVPVQTVASYSQHTVQPPLVDETEVSRVEIVQEKVVKSKKKWIVALAGLCVLAISVGGWFLFLNPVKFTQTITEISSALVNDESTIRLKVAQNNLSESTTESASDKTDQSASQASATIRLKPAPNAVSSEQASANQTEAAKNEQSSVTQSATAETNQGANMKPNTNNATLPAAPATSTASASAFDANQVATLFNNSFGSIGGTHSLYFKQIKDAKGNAVDGQIIAVNGQGIRAASVIKLFALGALMQKVNNGEMKLDTSYTVQADDITGGTGGIQYSGVGVTYTYEQLAHEMIANSDNTAMNIILKQLGGLDVVNQYISSLGYTQSKINRRMLDTAALQAGRDNYVAASEVGDFLARIYQAKLVSPELDAKMGAMLQAQSDHNYLEANLPMTQINVIYNKTGVFSDYGVVNDASLVETNKGTYVLVVLSQDGSEGEQTARMQQFGKQVFDAFQAQ